MSISNPAKYDDKESTNIRLEPELKKVLKKEVEEVLEKEGRSTTMSEIINNRLKESYSKGE